MQKILKSWPKCGDKVSRHTVWYDPLDDDQAIDHAVKWVLGNEQVFLNTVGDVHLLKKVLDSASHFDFQPVEEIMRKDLLKYGVTPLFTEELSGP